MNAQYKKGVVELCVLSLLQKHDCYGYEISEFLSGHIDISDGTVYPILRKLKADGLLTPIFPTSTCTITILPLTAIAPYAKAPCPRLRSSAQFLPMPLQRWS